MSITICLMYGNARSSLDRTQWSNKYGVESVSDLVPVRLSDPFDFESPKYS